MHLKRCKILNAEMHLKKCEVFGVLSQQSTLQEVKIL